ncbi:choice-of-anchor I family protein [Planctomycetaceae bacterium SH139]
MPISTSTPAAAEEVSLEPISTHATGRFEKSAAEIPVYCPHSQRVFVVNAESGAVDVFSLSDSGELNKIGVINASSDLPGAMGGVNSVTLHHGVVAVAVEARPNTDPGVVAFYDSKKLAFLGSVEAGALPDMVTFSPDGRWLLVANEGEPNEDYTVDPEGTVSIIDLKASVTHAVVRTVDFKAWNPDGKRAGELPTLKQRGLRHCGRVTLTTNPYTSRPSTFAEDMEPEWIEVTADSSRAFVCLQEANTIAEIEISTAKVLRLVPLGFKDHGLPGHELDVSDKDDGIRLRQWPRLMGVYQPDTIRLQTVAGRDYLVMANEGDARTRPYSDESIPGLEEGELFSDQAKLADWPLAGSPFEQLAGAADLGRLQLVRDLVQRELDDAGRPTRLFAFGGRSFSIFDLQAEKMVFDSGSDFERITAQRYPQYFNASNNSLKFEHRSRSKGPEPEGLALGVIAGRTYAFIGLERIGGIMVYDVTVPEQARHVGYFNHRRFDVPQVNADGMSNPLAGDSGAEGLVFISAEQSPTAVPLLVVGNETSGTTTVWQISAANNQD